MSRKYEFTGETMRVDGTTLHRIRAVRDFGPVAKGAVGGWVEREENLSHHGLCWISGDSQVFDDARIFGDSHVFDDAQVFDDARVYGNARIFGDSHVFGGAQVYGNARVYGNAQVYGYARISGDARIYGNTRIYGRTAKVSGDARIYGNARIHGTAKVSGDARIYGGTWDRSPLYVQGSRHPAHWGAPGILVIGCEEHSLDYWLRCYEEVGEKNDYSPEEIEEYRQIIEFFDAMNSRT